MKSKRIRLAFAAIVLGLVALSLTSCQSGQVNTFESASGDGVITDKVLAKAIHVGEVNRGAVSDLMKVQVTVRNASRRAEYFHYQFSWLDSNGMALNNPPPIWETKSLLGGETGVISAIAPSPQAADFRLQITRSKLPNTF